MNRAGRRKTIFAWKKRYEVCDMDYRINSDSNSWIIEKRHVMSEQSKTPGKVTWEPDGYYGDLLTAARALLDKVPRERTTDIEKLIQAVQEAREDVVREVIRIKNTREVEV